MRRIQRFWHYIKLSQKIRLTLLGMFAVITAIGVGGMWHISSVYNQEMYNLGVSNTRIIASELDGMLDSIRVFGDYFVGDDIIQNNLVLVNDPDNLVEAIAAKRALQRRLNSLEGTVSYIKDMALIFPNEDAVHSGDGLPVFSISEMRDNNERAIAAQGRPIWVSDELGNTYYIRQIRLKKYLKLDHMAVLYLKVDIGLLLDRIQERFKIEDELLLTIHHNATILFTNVVDHPEHYVEEHEDYSFVSVAGNKYLVIQERSSESSWYYSHYLDYQRISRQVAWVVVRSSIFLLLAMFVALFLIHLIVKRIIEHLEVLEEKMEHFEEGNMDLSSFPSYATRPDEIGSLHQHFDRMVSRFDTLINDNYLKQLLIKDNTIKMLSQQVNPHFLYNVLDSICWLSESYGAEDIAQMSYSLAHLFRLSISDDQACVPLRQELEFLDHYVKIQSLRFVDRLTYEQHISPHCLGVKVPKFSIQPLLENAIKHSMDLSDEVCKILLSVECGAEEVRISVSNTGSQFDENITEMVQSKKLKQSGNIGLVNIHERIELLFGSEYGLSFNNENDLATVSFTVPRVQGGVDNAEGSDC